MAIVLLDYSVLLTFCCSYVLVSMSLINASTDRPSKSWLDCVKEDYHVASGCNSNVEDMTIAAEDRKEWRILARLRERVLEAGYSND